MSSNVKLDITADLQRATVAVPSDSPKETAEAKKTAEDAVKEAHNLHSVCDSMFVGFEEFRGVRCETWMVSYVLTPKLD